MNIENEISQTITPNIPKPSYVVGIGASAGGLQPLQDFFDNMPSDSGMAFVVVQHISPDYKSLMSELLSRHTQMQIHRIEEGMTIEPNSIYLIPPKQILKIHDLKFSLSEKTGKSELPLMPINAFFISCAEELGDKSIGIVLSGTGTDGTHGIRAIGKAGGLTIVQQQDSAKFDGMPNSAIGTGLVDLVTTPEAMPSYLMDFARNPKGFQDNLKSEKNLPLLSGIDAIFDILKETCKIDFTLYKPATVIRRIERRITMSNQRNIEDYVDLLHHDSDELNSLYRDLLIGVTHFFRDPEAFEKIRLEVIPKLYENARQTCDEIRIWVAGCATGEEAYSLAILFHEYGESINWHPPIRIFATDAHRHSLSLASSGRYKTDAIKEVSEERLKRYFTWNNDHYQISNVLRKMITFAPQNIIHDAPFTRINLVTCRNMLIYFRASTQNQVIATLHFSLTVGGYLFLGSSETIGRLTSEFKTCDDHWRIYIKRRDIRLIQGTKLPMLTPSMSIRNPMAMRSIASPLTPDLRLLRAYDELLKDYLPAGFLVNENRELVHIFGDAGKFLRPSQGRVTLDLLEMLDTDLKVAITAAIQRCIKESDIIRYNRVRVHSADSGSEWYAVRVKPLKGKENDTTFVLVTLDKEEKQTSTQTQLEASEEFRANMLSEENINSLEAELQYTKENLQASIEEMETSNEELNATNEELIASNEELQSTNEELHSVNEELHTVNAEYQQKIHELTQLTDDMNNLLSSTEIGTIFLDRQLCVRRYTPAASSYFRLRIGDMGRPISEIVSTIDHVKLIEDCHDVITLHAGIEHEFRCNLNQWVLLRILPYKTADSVVEGVVLTMLDITPLKNTQLSLEDQSRQNKMILDSQRANVWLKDTKCNIRRVNKAVCEQLKLPSREIEGRPFAKFYPHDECQRQNEIDHQVIMSGEPVLGTVTSIVSEEDGSVRWVRSDHVPFLNHDGNVDGVLVVATDVTELQSARDIIEAKTRQFEVYMRHSPVLTWSTDENGLFSMINQAFEDTFGVTSKQCLGHNPYEVLSNQISQDLLHQMFDSSSLLENKLPNRKQIQFHVHGKEFILLVSRFTFELSSGKLAIGGSAVDITDLKQAEADLLDTQQRLELALEANNDGVWDWDTGDHCWYSERYRELLGFNAEDNFPEHFDSWKSRIHPDDLQNVMGMLKEHLENNATYDIEYRLQQKNGEYRWFRTRGMTIRDVQGNPVRMSGSIQDINDRVIAQNQLSLINKELEERIQERTSELEQARNALELRVKERTSELAASNQSLSARNNELDQFAHIAAHDLRSPLRTIAGFGQFLNEQMQEWDNEQAHEFMQRILSAASRMDSLIESLLTFSSVGRDKLSIEETDLNRILEEVKIDLSNAINESKAQIKADTLPSLPCDATKIRQLFQNLLSNSIKYSGQKSPEIQITVKHLPPDYLFKFEDNGIGFQEQDIKLLFVPFKRLNNMAHAQNEGHGVGLSICKRVVERHCGKIWAEAVPDKGATFFFTLPAIQVAHE